MKNHMRATFHLYLLVAVVAGCLAFALGGCKATGNTLARWGGAATGALAGGAVGGPAGAAVGAVAGDAGGDALVEDPPVVQNNTKIENNGGTVYASTAGERGWSIPWWWWPVGAVALLLGLPRTRPHVLGFLYSLVHGHPGAALAKAGAVLGWMRSAKADAIMAAARQRRGKTPPAVVVSSEVKPHA